MVLACADPTRPPRDELTPQELQVALVVAEGVTNREAAARLFLSPKTIEVHLSSAYRKLGVRTRTELSRRMASHQGRTPRCAPSHSQDCALRRPSMQAQADDRSPTPRHDQAVTAAFNRNRGRLVRAAGDGVLAIFDAPSEALRCAFDICEVARHGGVHVRAAVHLGEIDSFPDGEIQGISLRIAELVVAHASTGEVLVTQTVRDAVYGSSLVFRPRGNIDLSGAGNWNLFAAIPQ